MSNSKFLTPKIFDFFFLIFRISIDKFFIFCHIGLQNGLKQSLKIIYQYAIIIWVIFDPIAEILGGVKLTPPQAEWVDLDPPSRIGLTVLGVRSDHQSFELKPFKNGLI